MTSDAFQSTYPASEFAVSLESRQVRHKPSGIVFSFYEYTTEQDWLQAMPASFRENPAWDGDHLELARAAKRAAMAVGMSCRRP